MHLHLGRKKVSEIIYEALYLADIKTVVNLADSRIDMESYDGFAYSHFLNNAL